MNTITHTNSISDTFSRSIVAMTSPETRELLHLGREQGWNCNLLGQAPFPEEPVRVHDWLIVPAHLDSSNIPDKALQRVRSIYANGLRPKGFVVVHEAPKLLAAPGELQAGNLRMSIINPQVRSALRFTSLVVAGGAAVVTAISGLAILALAGLTFAALLLVPTALVMGVTILDPILIAVTEDGYWIEIDRWAA